MQRHHLLFLKFQRFVFLPTVCAFKELFVHGLLELLFKIFHQLVRIWPEPRMAGNGSQQKKIWKKMKIHLSRRVTRKHSNLESGSQGPGSSSVQPPKGRLSQSKRSCSQAQERVESKVKKSQFWNKSGSAFGPDV